MRIIVSDTSCLIDLNIAELLEPFAKLPYEIVVPSPLWNDELLSVPKSRKARLIRTGVDVRHLTSAETLNAQRYFNQYSPLRLNDCFALALAESLDDAILLTGDKNLKRVSLDHAVEAHGVMWATDQMHRHKCCPAVDLRRGLRKMKADPLVFVPDRLIDIRLKRYR